MIRGSSAFVFISLYCGLLKVSAGFESSLFHTHSLIFIPQEQDPAQEDPRLQKRSIDDNEVETETNGTQKLHRLAHDVKVQTDIQYRYAMTLITSQVRNIENRSREVYLTVILPETAFISRFAIEVEGQLFVAYVKEKEAAWKEYQEAVSKGTTAGHVGVSARHSNNFRVSVNTEANSAVVFYLLYEELLQRRRGFYHQIINITPKQKLKGFSIKMRIMEQRNITDVKVLNLRKHGMYVTNTSMEEDVSISYKSTKDVRIEYKPEVHALQSLLKSRHALQFAIEYDVERSDKGEILVIDGYFVHFVAPENLTPMPKHVIFVLDTSGSMGGKKLIQTKDAMGMIISELREQDYITIIDFNSRVNVWDYHDYFAKATESVKNNAMDYINSLIAHGNTNINSALDTALRMVSYRKEDLSITGNIQAMVIFLTDGHPTFGELNNSAILLNVLEANRDRVPIFTLAFGEGADFGMLKTLSLRNNGFARKIYVASDASLQLQGFYKEVSSPMLRDIHFVYQNSTISEDSLTSTNFHSYYKGGELVVAGHLASNDPIETEIQYKILATDANGEYFIDGQLPPERQSPAESETILLAQLPNAHSLPSNILERLWAYLTIQDLFKKVARGELTSCDPTPLNASSQTKRSPIFENETRTDIETILETVGDRQIHICDNIEYALFLSLKYEFVTPLTSLVVVKPNNQKGRSDPLKEGESQTPFITFSNKGLTLNSETLVFLLPPIYILNFLLK